MPFHFEEIPSTQTFLKELVQTDPQLSHLEYALSDVQTGGFGRHGRSWISERGNLFISIWLKNFSLPLTWIPHWIGTSLVDSLANLEIPTERLNLKWPNDLVMDQRRKAAGILCEKVGDGVVVGVGVNLLSAPDVSDRDTGCIHMLAPDRDFKRMNVALAEKLIAALKREPELSDLEKRYASLSLLKPRQAIEWLDLQTQQSGSGSFVRYGKFGELQVLENGNERSLYSEEIKLKL